MSIVFLELLHHFEMLFGAEISVVVCGFVNIGYFGQTDIVNIIGWNGFTPYQP